MFRNLVGALALMVLGGAAHAATLSGTFSVTAVNVTNLNSAQSQATMSNFNAALGGTLGDGNEAYANDTFTYTGDIDFRVGAPQTATMHIDDWLATGTGSVSGLDGVFGDLQLSYPNISNGTATTTFFLFTRIGDLTAGSFTIKHDDGVALYDDGVLRGGNVGPTAEQTTQVNGFDGGTLSFLYVATNGNPSVLEITTTTSPVPLPAGAWLMLGGLGALGALKRRRKAA